MRGEGEDKEEVKGRREGEGGGERKRRGGSCGLHFFKGTVVQDFWSEFFASNLSLDPTGPRRKTSLNKFEILKS